MGPASVSGWSGVSFGPRMTQPVQNILYESLRFSCCYVSKSDFSKSLVGRDGHLTDLLVVLLLVVVILKTRVFGKGLLPRAWCKGIVTAPHDKKSRGGRKLLTASSAGRLVVVTTGCCRAAPSGRADRQARSGRGPAGRHRPLEHSVCEGVAAATPSSP